MYGEDSMPCICSWCDAPIDFRGIHIVANNVGLCDECKQEYDEEE